MLRLFYSKAQGRKDFCKPSKTYYLSIHCTALVDYSYMWYLCASVSVIFQIFLHNFVLAKLATSSIKVKEKSGMYTPGVSTKSNINGNTLILMHKQDNYLIKNCNTLKYLDIKACFLNICAI